MERLHAAKQIACWAETLPTFDHDLNAQCELTIELGMLAACCADVDSFICSAAAMVQRRSR